ncbi:uncharacterized protein N7498_000210 [Penicillium cinerascens]|uniref:Zn(2)-C6 fungal-type domain-containing protein n=1 Tax=Penicillium cinerascens TaxID=70096 RepID=A0A9W9NDY8_9EURO|nr:uncharacterized protein N7498_000210 [Penicillium cinerascens]KAJ5218111.1 hypothetical protein N7498_000210 [Penicillium cinerascens]
MDLDSMAFANLYGYPNDSDVLDVENDDYNGVLDAPARQSHLKLPYPFGIFALPSTSDAGLSSTYSGPIADEAEPVQLNSEVLDPLDLLRFPQGGDMPRSPYTETDQKAKEKPSPDSQSPTPASKRRPHRPRRQNRSCDPCRTAKRACDLPPNTTFSNNFPSSPCSMCKLRGTVCTVAWRASKQFSHNTKKLASSVKSHVTDHGTGVINEPTDEGLSPSTPTSLSSHDCTLVYRTMASRTCSQKLGVYIDIFDIPMSKILSEKCVPPFYSLGIGALTPLRNNTQLAARFNQAELSIMNSWEMGSSPWLPTSATSRLFLTASILDLLFQRLDSRSGYRRLISRDVALTETHKWVAIATGSQFAVNENGAENKEKSHQQAKDIAYATWSKAKHMVFENIAASKSFRLGLSLLLFGTILPPTGTDQSRDFEEDAAYALQEGIRRLKILCAEARTCLQSGDARSSIITPLMGLHPPVQKQCLFHILSPEALENILELIAAFEWLVEMVQSVSIALSPFPSFLVAPSVNNFNTDNTHLKEKITQDLDVKSVDNGRNPRPMDDAIIARVKTVARPVTVLWTQGSAEQLVHSALLESGSFVVLMWKSLARLTIATQNIGAIHVNYEEIHQHFNRMIMLVDLWRTTFGTIDYDSAMSLQLSIADVRRSAIFCATDGDLAVLLFYELSCRLQSHLADQPLSPGNSLRETLKLTTNYRNSQRLISAMQISYLASTNHGVSSPGFQGKHGLKANIEDIRAHPHPTMVVQTYQLAAKGLAQEIQSSVLAVDIKRISDLSAALESCLRELQGLQSALVMYPATEGSDANITFS